MAINELDPIRRPAEVDEEVWEAMTAGERVRALKFAEDSIPLPARVYRELRELPSWAFYGPETGLPEDWFNRQGFLLPRFRPGGVARPLFLAVSRDIRLRRRVSLTLRERWGRRWRESGGWFGLAVAAVLTIALAVYEVHFSPEGQDWPFGVAQLVAIVAGAAVSILLGLLLPYVERAAIAWILWRRTGRRRLNPP